MTTETFDNSPKGLVEIYAAWAFGAGGQHIADAAHEAGFECSDGVAGSLWHLMALGIHAPNFCNHSRKAKDWGYELAHFYIGRLKRKKAYTGDWVNQAVRDGLCLALFKLKTDQKPEHKVDRRTYDRIVYYVSDRTGTKLANFAVRFEKELREPEYMAH